MNTTFTPTGLDALPPAEVARKPESVGVAKAGMDTFNVFVLAVLAGAFIALGGIFATTVAAGASRLPFGVVRLLAGLAFTLGLILVIVAGAELFTGNALIVMAWASRRVTWRPAPQLAPRLGSGTSRGPRRQVLVFLSESPRSAMGVSACRARDRGGEAEPRVRPGDRPGRSS